MKPITGMKRSNCWKPARRVWFQRNDDSNFDYQYARGVFRRNVINPNELKHYSGEGKREPHGIGKKTWKKAIKDAKESGELTIGEEGEY